MDSNIGTPATIIPRQESREPIRAPIKWKISLNSHGSVFTESIRTGAVSQSEETRKALLEQKLTLRWKDKRVRICLWKTWRKFGHGLRNVPRNCCNCKSAFQSSTPWTFVPYCCSATTHNFPVFPLVFHSLFSLFARPCFLNTRYWILQTTNWVNSFHYQTSQRENHFRFSTRRHRWPRLCANCRELPGSVFRSCPVYESHRHHCPDTVQKKKHQHTTEMSQSRC